MLRILVIEDHALVREGLMRALKSLEDEVEVFGAPEGDAGLLLAEKHEIDMVLLDLMLPGTGGLALLGVLRKRFPATPVVVLSAMDDSATVTRAMRQGASGFVPKSSSTETLLAALREVLDGDIYLPPALRDRPPATSRKASVAEPEQVRAMVEQTISAVGRLDILVNNAGIIRRGNLFSMQEADWDAVVAVNLKGTFNCAKHAAPYMKELGWGRIVNIASIAARLGDITSAPGYGASKAGVLGFTRALAMVIPATVLTVIGISVLIERLPLSWQRLLSILSGGVLVMSSLTMTQTALLAGPLWFRDYGLNGMQYGAQTLFGEVIPTLLERDPHIIARVSPTWANNPNSFADFFLNPAQRRRIVTSPVSARRNGPGRNRSRTRNHSRSRNRSHSRSHRRHGRRRGPG